MNKHRPLPEGYAPARLREVAPGHRLVPAAAREAKDWARADAIRDQIKSAGLEVEDTPTGPRWTIIQGSV